MNKVFRILAAVFAVVLLSGSAFAQTAATGNIEGIVTDATGAVLPGVTVVVKNTATNVAREATTDEDGRYRATALQPGTYEVAATLAGFQAPTIDAIDVQVGQTARRRRQDAARRRDRDGHGHRRVAAHRHRRTDVSNVVGEAAISEPADQRPPLGELRAARPGVTNDGNFGLVSYRGISGLYNNNTVDGADNNQAFFSEARGRTRTSYSISQAAIKEFQVGVSNFSAEFGRAAGGTVNAVTKSGTNAFRGEGFYFLRDDKFQSKDPFFPPASIARTSGGSSSAPASAARSSRTRSSTSSTTTSSCATSRTSCGPASNDVHHRAPARRRAAPSTLRVLQRPRASSSRAKATTRSCSARSTTR